MRHRAWVSYPVPAAAPPAPARGAPTAERRLVSVLFADLVGFTALSESRDAEEVRELLSRYFDTCKRLIALYGGTVEKFIGDAVMAVWGTPVATEDDPERAVRAGLDLVAAVSALGDELNVAGLRARAGVLTGEAAVTLGAEGEGMVAGDLVNTASRIQSVAEPGSVLVGEATRRATDQAIAYETAGEHELKGKEGSTPVWRALRVVSGRGGELKSEGLEAPFVGRDRELNLIKDLFHASAQNGRAHLVSVTGTWRESASPAGVGVLQVLRRHRRRRVYWHRGRCLAYGEGVAYWALADMVRMRCRIAEDEGPASAREKLAATLSEHVLDPEERAFVEPRLAHLLGLEDAASGRSTGSVRGLAPVLRTSRGHVSDRSCLRGHAVGRRRPARLRRVPARVVARPAALRDHARSSRAPRAAPQLGCGPAQLHLPLSGLALRERNARVARRARAGPARLPDRPDTRPRRGSAALRRRDRAHAARPRPRDRGRARVQADRRDRDARGARDPARVDRRPARRVERRRTPAPAGRAVLGKTFTQRALSLPSPALRSKTCSRS